MEKKKIIEIDKEEFKKRFKDIAEHGPFNYDKKRRHGGMHLKKEVKLFTDKAEMIEYVNGLEDIENVDIFKIENDLYKVLVTRRKRHHDCCHDEDNDCCNDQENKEE
jgi:hypothetical protein